MDLLTIEKMARASKLSGWELVEYVRILINENMIYSNDVPYLFHKKAFEKGKGYCVQQALCVRDVLRELGFDVKTVFCRKARFPDKFSGHTWNRVTIDGETRDVCSCRKNDTVSNVSFLPVTPVKKYTLPVIIAGFLGSIPVCFKRKHAK